LKSKIIGTEFVGQHYRIKARGTLKDIGIKELYSLRSVNLALILNYLLSVEPEKITEHTYRFGNYMLKFYPPESFGFLGYCQNLGLPVENAVAMGVDNDKRGDILIVDRIEGEDFKEIILRNGRHSFFRVATPDTELKALGRTVYLFCLKGIIAGDSKLQNYMYDGKEAARIDLVPQHDSISGLNWKEINENLEKIKESSEVLVGIASDIFCIIRDMAEILTHQKRSKKRFLKGIDSFLQGFVNDELSRIFAFSFLEYAKQMTGYIEEAEKESKSFHEIFLLRVIEKTAEQGGELNIRLFEH